MMFAHGRCFRCLHVIVVSLSCGSAMAAEIHVPGDAPTIAAAMSLASDGDTIVLAPGTYSTPFDFTKAVTIVGDANAPSLYRVRPIPSGELSGEVMVPVPKGQSAGFVGVELAGAVYYHVAGGTFSVTSCRVGAPGDLFPAIEGTGTALRFEDCIFSGAGWFAEIPMRANGASLEVLGCSTQSLEFASGLIRAIACDVLISESLISGCAGGLVPLIGVDGGSLQITDSQIGANEWMPAIRTDDATVRIESTDLLGNAGEPSLPNSAFELFGSSVEMRNVYSSGNGSPGDHPPYTIAADSIVIEDATFFDESFGEYGEGVCAIAGSFEIARCHFLGNETLGDVGVGSLFGHGALVDCSFVGNLGGDGVGAVRVNGSIEFRRCKFDSNLAGDGSYFGTIQGGAAHVTGGTVAFIECDFQSNHAGFDLRFAESVNHGGAIAVTGGDLYVERCRFYDNRALTIPSQVAVEGRGGAIAISAGTATIVDSDFSNNVAAGSGGAIYSAVAETTVINCTIVGNSAFDSGGLGGFGSITSSLVCGNDPDDAGAGWIVDGDTSVGCNVVRVPGDALTIQAGIDSVETGGVVLVAPGEYVGAFSLSGKSFLLLGAAGPDETIVDGTGLNESICLATQGETQATRIRGLTFRNGTSGHLLGPGVRAGGAIYAFASSPQIERCRFTGNSSNFGGAVYGRLFSGAIRDSVFDTNTATDDAGALQLFGGAGEVVDCRFTENEAGLRGGACHVVEGDFVMSASLFEGNSAPLGGAISWSFNPPTPESTPLHLDNVVIRGNAAPSGAALAVTPGNTLPTLHLVTICGNDGNAVLGAYVDLGCNVVTNGTCDAVDPWPDVDNDGILDCEDPCIGRCVCNGDLDRSDSVDGGDLAILLGAWGSGGTADLDGSGTVDGGDLAVLLGAWGPCE